MRIFTRAVITIQMFMSLKLRVRSGGASLLTPSDEKESGWLVVFIDPSLLFFFLRHPLLLFFFFTERAWKNEFFNGPEDTCLFLQSTPSLRFILCSPMKKVIFLLDFGVKFNHFSMNWHSSGWIFLSVSLEKNCCSERGRLLIPRPLRGRPLFIDFRVVYCLFFFSVKRRRQFNGLFFCSSLQSENKRDSDYWLLGKFGLWNWDGGWRWVNKVSWCVCILNERVKGKYNNVNG